MEVSIDEPLNVDWDGNELLLSDILGTEEDIIYRDIETEAEQKMLSKAIERLKEREKTIVMLRFGINRSDGKEMTQKEVADLLGISQSYISRLEKKIMKRLQKEMLREENGRGPEGNQQIPNIACHIQQVRSKIRKLLRQLLQTGTLEAAVVGSDAYIRGNICADALGNGPAGIGAGLSQELSVLQRIARCFNVVQ